MSEPTDQWPSTRLAEQVNVASHRRSGTHLALEYITRELRVGARKTHEFAGSHPHPLPTVYVVRSPIEVLWSTYRWMVQGASNQPLADALSGLTFAQFLRGDGGQRTGFAAFSRIGADSLLDARGMFYQPVRFWADHVQSYLDLPVAPLIVHHDALVADPLAEVRRIARHLGLDAPSSITPIPVTERVGHWASAVDAAPAVEHWDADSLEMLEREAGSVLHRLGRPLRRAAPVGARRAATAPIRYIARDGYSGLGVAAGRCMRAMVSVGLDVVWEPSPNPVAGRRVYPRDDTSPFLLERYRPTDTCTTTIVHTGTERWPWTRKFFPGGRFIGHLAWELGRLPAGFQGDVHSVDALWVPTAWNAQTFGAGGYTRPTSVVPHVIDTTAPEPHGLDIPDDVQLFTTIAAWHPRKRPDLAVEAFARAFTRRDRVMMVVKTPETTDAMPATDDLQRMTWWRLMQVLRKYPDAPNVVLVNDRMTAGQIRSLLERTDCYVSLAASEGWGLGQFDAAVLGKPVVTTGFGGHLEYFGVDHPGLVPYTLTPIGETEHSPLLEPDMEWAAPDVDAAARMLREVFEGESPIARAAPALAERLQRQYAPTAVGEHILSVLEQMH